MEIGRIAWALMLILSACSTEPFTLHAVNVDGPRVQLIVNGEIFASLGCGESTELVPESRPDAGGTIPGLPWTLEVRSNGGLLENGAVRVDWRGPTGLLVRETTVLTGSYPMAVGPAPSQPCSSP